MVPSSDFVNILHLTDLHFRKEESGTERTERTLAVKALFDRLEDIKDSSRHAVASGDDAGDWRPHIVAISGDISYSGRTRDFEEAGRFLNRLVEALGIELGDVVVCPGNHDRNQEYAQALTYPPSSEEADRWLNPEMFKGMAPLVAPFREFSEFCKSKGLIKATGLEGLEYLTGVARKDLPKNRGRIDFLVMNSAWFAQPGGKDIRNLWIGLPMVERLNAGEFIQRTRNAPNSAADADRVVRVALMHHPREWFNEEEHDTYSSRPNTYRYLTECCDIILHGHVHGALEPPSFAYGNAQTFTGGATYSGGRYRNNLSILQVNFDDMSVRRRGFEYDPRTQDWAENDQAAGVHLLRGLSREYPVETAATDLSGDWASVFWAEASPDLRKPVHQIRFEAVADAKGRFRGRSNDAMTYDLEGELVKGMFSGIWRSRTQGKVRHGVFQLRVTPGGNSMSGRWLGYNGHNDIRVGRWKFSRAGKESGA